MPAVPVVGALPITVILDRDRLGESQKNNRISLHELHASSWLGWADCSVTTHLYRPGSMCS